MKPRHMILAFAAASATLAGCTDKPSAERTLTRAGYTDIDVGGYGFFACGEDDTFSTNFTAKNPQGQQVEGTVCGGWLKKDTIRF